MTKMILNNKTCKYQQIVIYIRYGVGIDFLHWAYIEIKDREV